MKASLFCGVICAALLGASGYESKPLEELNKPEVPQATYFPPTTPPAYNNYNYLPYWSYNAPAFEAPAHCNFEITHETVQAYRHAIYNMSAPLFNRAAALTEGHFVLSPYTIWLTLAALAEGASGQTQQDLFKLLSLPENVCVRQAFYHLATHREPTSNDIVLARNRLFVVDSSVHVNTKWEEYVQKYTQLKTVSVPFKANPVEEVEQLKKVFKAHLPNINLSGNSLLLESLDYHGLWTNAFDDAVIQEGPFYNSFGEQIGVVEYMKTVKKVNVGIVPGLNLRVIDLPVGRDGRYHMYIAMPLANKENYARNLDSIDTSMIVRAVADKKLSSVPVEIIIPKMSMTSEVDVRQLLDDIGIKSLWTDPLATRNISEPAALPSAFVQRVTVTLDNGGVRPATQEYHNFVPPLHPSYKPEYNVYPSSAPWNIDYKVETTFVANKPFLFGLFDSETLTSLFAATFSKIHK